MNTVAAKPITPDEFLEMGDDAKGYELIDGQLVEKPVSKESSRVGSRVGRRLDEYADAHGGWAYNAELGYRCFPAKPNQVRKADASYISFARMPAETYEDEGFCSTCPEIAVEVLSPDDNAYEVDAKTEEWLAAGAREVWLVNPELQVVRLHRADGTLALLRAADTLTSPLLPGFAVPVADLFRRPGG
jgi:Uma2 family endonuclease